MTKIPSVEERVEELCKKLTAEGVYWVDIYKETYNIADQEGLKSILTQALTADRTALLTELMDSGLLEEMKHELQNDRGTKDGHNSLARAIKAYINNLINPTRV